MLRGTPDHPKTADLMQRLGISKPLAVGLLEMLWHFTAEYARRGDVGRFTDEQLARALGWEDDPGTLVAALVGARFLDKHRRHRLIVHDWYEHANDAVHMRLARSHERFASGQIPRLSRISSSERNEITEWFRAHAVRTPCAPPGTGRDGSVTASPRPGPGGNGRGAEAVENPPDDPDGTTSRRSRSIDQDDSGNVRGRMTDSTASQIVALAQDLATATNVGAAEWITRASRIEPNSRSPGKSFSDPGRPGLSEAWGRTTLRKLLELAEDARRPVPL